MPPISSLVPRYTRTTGEALRTATARARALPQEGGYFRFGTRRRRGEERREERGPGREDRPHQVRDAGGVLVGEQPGQHVAAQQHERDRHADEEQAELHE